ncbi:MAG: DUF4142 domain-containing protein [Tatlockia sp.]|nr:DUF4142 domain-containing protein [Tatlockia sp.]
MNCKHLMPLVAALFFCYPIVSSAHIHPTKVSAEQAKSEGIILGTLAVINKNEIAAGHLAEEKSANPEVRDYALLMIKEHGDNLNKTEALSNKLGIKPIKGKVALKLQAKGKKELATLKKLKGSSFDKAYIAAMVKGHVEALNLINTLINESSNPLVKKHLEKTKPHVEHHLTKAKDIKKSIS